jgi:hypothetical protein
MIKTPNTNILPTIKDLCKPVLLTNSMNMLVFPADLNCGIPEIKKFEAALPGYQLNVVSKEYLNALIYSGPEAEKHIYLYHHNNHYDIITSCLSFLPESSIAINASKVMTRSSTTLVATYACYATGKAAPSWDGNIATTVIDIIKVRNATPAINVTTAPPNLYVGPLSSARDVVVS